MTFRMEECRGGSTISLGKGLRELFEPACGLSAYRFNVRGFFHLLVQSLILRCYLDVSSDPVVIVRQRALC